MLRKVELILPAHSFVQSAQLDSVQNGMHSIPLKTGLQIGPEVDASLRIEFRHGFTFA